MKEKIVLAACAVLMSAPMWAGSQATQDLNGWGSSYGVSAQPVKFNATAEPVPAAGKASAPAPQLPDEFTIHENVGRKLVSTLVPHIDGFVVESGSEQLGTVQQWFKSLHKAFEYDDAQGCVAQAQKEIRLWGVHVDVTDCDGRPIGAIEEHVLKSMIGFGVYSFYSILDSKGTPIAKSEKREILATNLYLTSLDGKMTFVDMHRATFSFHLSDNWDIKILDQQAIDPRLVVMAAVYKSSADNDRRRAQAWTDIINSAGNSNNSDSDKDKDSDK